jgi:cytochrome c5
LIALVAASLGGVCLGLRASLDARTQHASATAAIASPPAPSHPAAWLRTAGCEACHLATEPATPAIYSSFELFRTLPLDAGSCAACHVNNALAVAALRRPTFLPLSDATIERVKHAHAYQSAPDLTSTFSLATPHGEVQLSMLQRFSDCGLREFLERPVPRRLHASDSMYRMAPDQISALIAGLNLEHCSEQERSHTAPAAAQLERGRQLFETRGCKSCHGAHEAAPLLRIGRPLFARWYLAARVRAGSAALASRVYGRRWSVESEHLVRRQDAQALIMPEHLALDPDDIDALATYLANDNSDLAVREPRAVTSITADAWSRAVAQAMYRAVQHQVFDTSCRHCHDAREGIRPLISRAIGGSTTLEFPMSRLPTPTPSAALSRALSPGPNCSQSRLVMRLRARRDEWLGDAKPDAARGMPLTLPPLSEQTIRLTEAWTQHGCPSDNGPLCDACMAGHD